MRNKYFFIVGFFILFSCHVQSQNYNGFFGKKNLIGFQLETFPSGMLSVVRTTELDNVWLAPSVEYRRVVSKYGEMGVNLGYLFNEHFTSQDATYSAAQLTFDWRYFRKKKYAAIAPVGKYFGIEVQGSYGFIDDYFQPVPLGMYAPVNTNVYNHESIITLFPAIKFGQRKVFMNDVYLDFAVKIGTYPLILQKGVNFSESDIVTLYLTQHLFSFSLSGGKIR